MKGDGILMEDHVDEAIKKICSEIKIENGGRVKLEGPRSFTLKDQENIVLTELNKDQEFNFKKLQNYTKFYYVLKDNFPLIFFELYGKIKSNNDISYKGLKKEINKQFRKFKKRKIRNYDLYFPINIKPEKKLSKFQFKDISVDFTNDEKIISKIRSDERTNQALHSNKNFSIHKTVLCKISLKGRNHEYAIQKGEKLFNYVMGVIGYFETRWSYPLTIIGFTNPISKLNAYCFFIFEDKRYETLYWYNTRENKSQILELKEVAVKDINSTLSKCIKSKQQELLFELFTQFYLGVTNKDVDYSFLAFWRVVELGIMKEPNQKQKELVEILESVTLELEHTTKYNLQRFYNLRNDFVHKGIADINQNDRNGIKSFAGMIIAIYIKTLRNYNKEEIKSFYYYIKRKKNISTHLKMAKKIYRLLKQIKK